MSYTNVIALWSGTLATIPANWNLCDGSNNTPNLIDKFIKGAAESVEPGSTGGNATHTHTMTESGSHRHTSTSHSHSHGDTPGSHGTHNHGGTWCGGYNSSVMTDDDVSGYHTHTTGSNTHSHTTEYAGAHTHTINAASNEPAFYEVAFIQATVDAVVTSGIICFWGSALSEIPANWDVCDGDVGRPNLSGKFLRGISTNSTDPGTTGGNDNHTHTIESNSDHNHTHSSDSHTHSTGNNAWTHDHNTNREAGTNDYPSQTDSGHSHNHGSLTGGSHQHTIGNAGSHNSHVIENGSTLPAYKETVPIFSSDTDFRGGCVCLWAETIASIPEGWGLCDGSSGTPDYRERFLRCTISEPGSIGGGSHTHTEDGNDGSHNGHSWSSTGGHDHSVSSAGAHTHTTSIVQRVNNTSDRGSTNSSGGSHTHGNVSSVSDHNHDTNSDGSHNHEPWSDETIEPEHYEIVFIMKLIPPPETQALSATNITSAEARLRAEITDDGGDSGNVEARFRWRTT